MYSNYHFIRFTHQFCSAESSEFPLIGTQKQIYIISSSAH